MTDLLDTHDRATQLVEYRPRVYRHLLAMTRDPGLADDLTQETFLRAVSHIGQLRHGDAALGWPDDYRVVLLLHDGHGLTNPEIAAQLQCSLATVKIRVHRARSRLRATLVDACDFGADDRGELVCEQR